MIATLNCHSRRRLNAAYPPRPKAEPQSGLDAGCKSAADGAK